ncbi:hypothetical protein LJ739_08775 [Aestuariibacter halophilus]|uniref:Uncharacterized protein n=1 Tax=Fluctibacter halophilus TaxID=226011 RepID=A0ABS8G6V8_9ALTE|nr:hypothetical protein [Aestuariibacter halophilus]MCC2616332.1 hypothetical protein [Aestuariibacter halophilus]
MTFKKAFLTLAICSGVIAGSSLVNAQSSSSNDYLLHAYQDCKLIKTVAMDHDVILAYQDLQEASDEMTDLQMPIDAIQEDIDRYSEDIKALTKLAIIEDGQRLVIDKTLLKQQEAVADQLQALIAQHQGDFDAIGHKGKHIGEVAKRFEQGVKDQLQGIDYDQIKVQTPDSDNNWECDADIMIM